MTDIVERLRGWPLSVNGPHTAELCIEAADEIERLQAVHKRDLAEYNRVAADVTRLRAALERIARDINEGPPGSNWQDGYNAAARIAREVLNDENYT